MLELLPREVLAGEQRGGKETTSTSPSKWARGCTEIWAHLWGRGPRATSAQRSGGNQTKSGTAPKLFPEKWETGELGQGLSQDTLTQGCCKPQECLQPGNLVIKNTSSWASFLSHSPSTSRFDFQGAGSQQTPEQQSQRNGARLAP